jgi:hypothetical protein
MVVAIVGFAALAAASYNGIFIFSRTLAAQDLNPDETSDQHLIMLKDHGNDVGGLFFAIDGAVNSSLQRMWVDISHYNGTLLDSVTFKFTSHLKPISVYIDASYPPVPISFHKDHDTIIITLKPVGIFTQGTFHCDFVLQNLSSDQISFEAEVTIHQPASLQLTALKANVYIPQILPTYLQR